MPETPKGPLVSEETVGPGIEVGVPVGVKSSVRRSRTRFAWSAKDIRDTLGLLGVIASLLFVGLEIRQNTRVARAEAYRGVEQTMIEWNNVAATDDELVPVLRAVTFQGMRRDELADPDKWRVGVMYDSLVRAYESIYRQVEEDILPASALDRFVNIGFSTPYMKDLWPVIRANYREDFALYFESRFGLLQ